MARQRVLWDAIDSDRRRWIRATLVVMPFVVLAALSIFSLVATGNPQAIEFVIRAVAPLTAIVLFPVLRGWRAQSIYQSVGAVPAVTGTLPITKSALADASLAAGLTQPAEIYVFTSEALNAFIWKSGGRERIAVSSGFSVLPEAEQRAGIAMLLGRLRVDVTAFAAEHEMGWLNRKRRVAPEDDPDLFRAWLDAAVAGDREALEMLLEPAPMICLLERLSASPRAVPEFARNRAMQDACFNFLAWPYGRWWRAASDTQATSALPPRAQAAVAAVIAEEVTSGHTLGDEAEAGLGDAEAVRAQRLREVSGAEGAIAGSTSAASGTAATAGVSAAAAPDDAPGGAAPAPARGEPELAPERQPPPYPPPPVPVAVAVAAGAAPELAVTVPPPTPAESPVRIDVTCRHCGADNAPGNRVCIRCGAPLSASH